MAALIHLREFTQFLATGAQTEYGGTSDPRQDQVERLHALRGRGVPEQVLSMFHAIRKVGNDATHKGLTRFNISRPPASLAVWFYRTVRHAPNFKPGPFVNRSDPSTETPIWRLFRVSAKALRD